ncbi:MAG: PRC-barrel domain-containing protein [Phycisphaerales bacterium]|nr:PRC-barrel domain-containing protein [Phycisphaerales bacterium]
MKAYRFVATAAAVLLGLGASTSAQQSNTNPDRDRKHAEQGRKHECSAKEIAEMARTMKRSLADSITAAERHCGGRAVRGECRMHNDGGNAAADRKSNEMICLVTLIVDDKQLVEAAVNLDSGQVVSKRNIDTYVAAGSHPGDTTLVAFQEAGSEPRNQGNPNRDQDSTRRDQDSTRRDQGTRTGARAADFAMTHRWQKTSELIGLKVVNKANEDLGKVEEIVVDAANGRVLYGVLSFGGFLGIGDKLFAIPWQSLDLSGDAKAYVLAVDKERLQNASGFDKSHWPNFADPQWATTTYKYYDQTPYWDTQPAGDTGSPDRARMSSEERWYNAPQLWQKARDLMGKEVRNANNEQLGNVTDLIVDPDAGRIIYAIVTYRNKLFAIPFSAIPLRQDAKFFELPGGKELLQDSVAFTKESYPNFADKSWATKTHTHYKVDPYWRDR